MLGLRDKSLIFAVNLPGNTWYFEVCTSAPRQISDFCGKPTRHTSYVRVLLYRYNKNLVVHYGGGVVLVEQELIWGSPQSQRVTFGNSC